MTRHLAIGLLVASILVSACDQAIPTGPLAQAAPVSIARPSFDFMNNPDNGNLRI